MYRLSTFIEISKAISLFADRNPPPNQTIVKLEVSFPLFYVVYLRIYALSSISYSLYKFCPDTSHFIFGNSSNVFTAQYCTGNS
jgi:hypothetical protein